MRRSLGWPSGGLVAATLLVVFLSLVPERGAAEDSPNEPTTDPSTQDAGEIARKLANPVSDIWGLQFQQNTTFLDIEDHASRANANLIFQPLLPLHLTDQWNLINRPVFTLVNDTPYVDGGGEFHRTTGFGDTILATLLSPNKGHWLLGIGPSFVLPTASSDHTGQGKWQVGPAGVIGYQFEKFLVGVFPQQWWSFAGSGQRDNVSQLNCQYFIQYFPAPGWNVGMGPNILVDWKASGGNRVTFPIGLGMGKVVRFGKLPIKFQIEGQFMPVRPDPVGQMWNIRIQITPVIPVLVKRNLLG